MFFSKQCFSHIRKVFVAFTCDFLLIFGECATLMGRKVLSRRFFKVCIFRSLNYGNKTFWHVLGPPHIFSISSTQTILILTLFCTQSLKKFGWFVLEISFQKRFRYCGFWAKILPFYVFFVSKNMSYWTLWFIFIVLLCKKQIIMVK